MDKLNLVSIHPLGLYSARITQNFRERADKKTFFRFQHQTGNVFHPPVEVYLPDDPAIREEFSQMVWHHRYFAYENEETTPAQRLNIFFDAVIKTNRVEVGIPIKDRFEVLIAARTFQATRGRSPGTLLSGDRFIEWFHSKVAGGEDPFGRKLYGLDQRELRYVDENRNEMVITNGDLVFAGLETELQYYINPWPDSYGLSMNTGLVMGINTASYNRSVDLGLSFNTIKRWDIIANQQLRLGAGYSVLRRNVMDFGDNIILGTNRYIGSGEAMLEWTKVTRLNNYHSIGVNYQHQTSYRNKDEEDYYFIPRKLEDEPAGWHNGYSTLIRDLSYWTLQYTYGRRNYKFQGYLKQDFSVNNVPDIETGLGIVFFL